MDWLVSMSNSGGFTGSPKDKYGKKHTVVFSFLMDLYILYPSAR